MDPTSFVVIESTPSRAAQTAGLDVVDGPDGDAQAQGVRDLDGLRGEERDVEVERRRVERLEVRRHGRVERLPRQPDVGVGQHGADRRHRRRRPAPGHRGGAGESRDGAGGDQGVLGVGQVDEQGRPTPVEPFERTVEPRDPVEAIAEPGDVAPVYVGHPAGVAPHPAEGLVVQQDGDAVGGAADVDLDHLGAERLGDRDGGQGVLTPDTRCTAMGDEAWRTHAGPPVRAGRDHLRDGDRRTRRHPRMFPDQGEPQVTPP